MLFSPLPPWPADLEAHPGMGAAATEVQAHGPLQDGTSERSAEQKERPEARGLLGKPAPDCGTIDLKALPLLKVLSPVVGVLTGQVQL